VSGPVCGDGTVNGPEQCDGSLPANWICTNTSNPWETLSQALSHPPTCSPSSCAITCATGRACENIVSPTNLDADSDEIGNACDPNDDSGTDGCLDDARDCATVNLVVHSVSDINSFDVYIDNHLVGQAGRAYVCSGSICALANKDVTVSTLSRGLHNLRIVFAAGTPLGDFTISGAVDWAAFPLSDFTSPGLAVGDGRNVDFTVR
jgi:hypothetical protein